MIPGLLAAAGYERSDTNYTVQKAANSTNFTFTSRTFSPGNGTSPNSVTIEIGTPSDTRYVMVGCIGWDVSQQGNGAANMFINGTAVENYAETTQNFTNGTESLFTCVGSLLVPTGTTATVNTTIDLSGTGFLNYYWAVFDCGIIGPYFTTGSDTTPTSSGVLSVADMGGKSGALVFVGYEDNADSIASIAWNPDPDSDGLTREITQEATILQITGFRGEAVLVNGPPSETFPIKATPSSFNTGDAAVLQYITAHYS